MYKYNIRFHPFYRCIHYMYSAPQESCYVLENTECDMYIILQNVYRKNMLIMCIRFAFPCEVFTPLQVYIIGRIYYFPNWDCIRT